MQLTCRLAQMVVRGEWACLHAVAFGLKVPRELLFESAPAKRCVRDFCAGIDLQQPCQLQADISLAECRHAPLKKWRRQAKAETVLRWVDATSHIRDLRDAWQCLLKVGRILCTSNARFQKLLRRVKRSRAVCRETIRLARVRLDCVAMIVHRVLLRSVSRLPHATFLYADGSPQWRGLETYAASWDLDIFGGGIEHRLFPLIALEREQMDVVGKAVGLLWQIALTVGLEYMALRSFLAQVRALTTDFGTEHRLVDIPDFLIDWCRAMRIRVPPGAVQQRHLFPHCVPIAGWRHIFDNLICRGTSVLRWFPAWLDKWKAIVATLRTQSLRDTLVRSLKSRNLLFLADAVDKASVPSFAKWRWGTLDVTCSSVGRFFESLRLAFDPRAFRRPGDAARHRKVCQAFASGAFLWQFRFVRWFAQWLGEIQRWIGMCDCPPSCARVAGERTHHLREEGATDHVSVRVRKSCPAERG